MPKYASHFVKQVCRKSVVHIAKLIGHASVPKTAFSQLKMHCALLKRVQRFALQTQSVMLDAIEALL